MRSRTFKLQRFRIQKYLPYEKILLNLAHKAEQEQQSKMTDRTITEKSKRLRAEEH